ncbi:MAG: cytochrome c, partial [Alphaproteobacteria bacterium]
FLDHCAACHGESAEGNGPLAPLLNVPVADLTRIAARRGGEFPLAEVVRIIDGRAELRGHGGPMLVFGQILGGGRAVVDAPEGGVIETRGDIFDIALWLRSIQRLGE